MKKLWQREANTILTMIVVADLLIKWARGFFLGVDTRGFKKKQKNYHCEVGEMFEKDKIPYPE